MISVYTICYNEEVMLPYFLQHYQTFADRITVYDNMSTDRSAEIARGGGAIVSSYDTGKQVRDDIMLGIKEKCWQGDKSDWVIVVDVDEFLHCDDPIAFLRDSKEQGYTAILPQGYQMIGRQMPKPGKQIYEQLRTGVVDNKYSKLCCFNPSAILSIGYSVGCHKADPKGNVVIRTGPKLLHYNYLTLEWHLRRYRERGARLSELNVAQGWGTDYLQDDRRTAYNRLLSHSRQVI